MRILDARALSAVSVCLIACGGGGSAEPDALVVIPDAAPDAPPDAPPEPTFDFSCASNPEPTTADDPITVAGSATGLELEGLSPTVVPLTDATVEACVGDCVDADRLDVQTTQADGCPDTGCAFTSAPIATGGEPVDGYVRVSKPDYRTSNVFPDQPITANVAGVPALAILQSTFDTLVAFTGSDQDPGNGNVALVVTDCGFQPLAGATVSVKQGGEDVGTIVDLSQFDSSAAGTFLVFDVPPGATEVSASFDGMDLRAHTITTFAGQTSATQIRPGF